MELVFLISEDGSQIELFIFSLALMYSNIAVLSRSFSNFNDTPLLVGQKYLTQQKIDGIVWKVVIVGKVFIN